MDIATVPTRNAPPAMLWREACRDGAKVRTRPLANRTAWAPARIDALRRTLTGECEGLCGALAPTGGPIFAVLCVRPPRADRLGLTRVRGTERLATLTLFLVLARGAAQGSRLAAVRWADQHAVAETLGHSRFDANNLSQALEARAPRQDPSEEALSRVVLHTMGRAPTGVVYAVPSASLADAAHARAACGARRATKPSKAQSVIGVVTRVASEPVAVHVVEGTLAAPGTVPAQVTTLRTRLRMTEVGCVGDRGRLKTQGQAALAPAGATALTALTTPQMRTLLRAGVVHVAWWTSQVHAVEQGPRRLVRRRRAAVRRKEQRRRHDTRATLSELSTTRHACVRPSQRARPEAGWRALSAWLKRHQLSGGVPGA